MAGPPAATTRSTGAPARDAIVGSGTRHAGAGATPCPRTHVVDDVSIAASSVGLALTCLVCRARELVTLDEPRFNQQVERFLLQHPGACGSGWDGRRTA